MNCPNWDLLPSSVLDVGDTMSSKIHIEELELYRSPTLKNKNEFYDEN